MNTLQRLIIAHPDEEWDFTVLSTNPNITIEFMDSTPQFPWEYESYCANLNFTSRDFNHPKFKCNWSMLSRNQGIQLRNITHHHELPWDFDAISMRTDLTMEFIELHITKKWNWAHVSANLALTMTFVLRHPEIKWHWDSVFRHAQYEITQIDEFIKSHKLDEFEHSVYWMGLSMNPHTTLDMILQNPDLPWYESFMVSNPNMTPEFMTEHFKSDVDYEAFSTSPNLTIKYLIEHADAAWEWRSVTGNSAITMADISNNPDLPWDMDYISTNPNLTSELVASYPFLNWNFRAISGNMFAYAASIENRHFRKLRAIRARVLATRIPSCYNLYLLTRTRKFMEWYCAPGNLGNTIDKRRILNMCNRDAVTISANPIIEVC
jgi:hypothetical protein